MEPLAGDSRARPLLLPRGQMQTLCLLLLEQNPGEPQAFQILEFLRKGWCQGCPGLELVGAPDCKRSPEAQSPAVQVGVWAVPTCAAAGTGDRRRARQAFPTG